jgi:hypothetical protein
MPSNARKSFATLSTFGFVASIILYLATFTRASMELMPLFVGLFGIGVIVLLLPIFVLDDPASRAPLLFYRGSERNLPRWVGPCKKILALIVGSHFIWSVVGSGWGYPQFRTDNMSSRVMDMF